MSVPAAKIDFDYTLEHKYTRERGRVYLSGVQALVRLPLMQQMRDRAAGLSTAGFISGYRGSPLGGFDLELWKAKKHLKASNVEFTPGLNEDLGATMVWGTQQANLFPGARYDGVFSMWYGKGPGVDRCGDVFKHGNAAGTSKNGGVLALAADDHACRSSTLPHGSELEFVSAMMPILNPAGVQDILDMGLLGWAMSRFTGRWVGFKTIAETVESSASVNVNPHQLDIVIPTDFEMPPNGLNIRWPDPPLDQEMRLHQYAVKAACAFARANKLDRVVLDSPQARLGIVTTGKSYLDVLQALEYLGINARDAREIGIRVYKVGMTWPLEPIGIREFARGLEDIIVVEEKRSFLESQMKEYMFNWPDTGQGGRPHIVGKCDEDGNWILPSTGELTPAMIALVVAKRLSRFFSSEAMTARVAWIAAKEHELTLPRANFPRVPHYCSGCPHNTSTNVPEDSRALGGIGCHYMVTWMDRRTDTFTQMGGEGATWCGQAPFTNTKHVFQNLGDGTYFHSGSLAIRQAVAAGVNITYKILYNDAVAMTGGQPVDGKLSVPAIAHQVRSEGVATIVVMSDDIEKWSDAAIFPADVEFIHRDELDAVQKRLREVEGVSVLIYDQTCATEKRRRRKRGKLEDPNKRVFINSLVCEGCGDCGKESFCVSVLPKETEYGRKREIDQSGCNKDFSCVKGFCPSFVTVHGGGLKKRKPGGSKVDFSTIPQPQFASDLSKPWNILVTGIGGTGVVTIGALIGMAAHLEGKGGTVLDQTGLAQKGGAVTCHLRIAKSPADIHAVRIAAGEADAVLGCDMVVVNDYWSLSKIRAGRSRVVLNSYEAMPGSFTMKPDMQFPAHGIIDAVRTALGGQMPEIVDATDLAVKLLGDSIGANLFMLGYAWQKGWVPLSLEALMRAVELNGAAVEMNKTAFNWGRMAAHDIARVRDAAGGTTQKDADTIMPLDDSRLSTTLDECIARRIAFLTDYQNAAYATKYKNLADTVRAIEQAKVPGSTALTEAVARYAFKLMAYKDEYEVARLYTAGDFEKRIREQFDGDFRLHFHLAPPLLARRDSAGKLRKGEYGSWVFGALKLLAKLRGLRGSAFDIFGYTAERKHERALIGEYFTTVDELLAKLDRDNLGLAVDIASVPEHIRGYGHIKHAHLDQARTRREQLLAAWRNPQGARVAA
ncbi:MAG: indolepyruvate ferredoxin oxidoreductase family protein [Xanthomonadaceae bacterium]|nr:indolepyruvate ferredoxin oxidoreductase family protein [Xanthomonadaceae bacterium]MDE1884598.1 indolepyruvate ferredoxin oxidoreductase family protein [Xanthomonadaceae bacterium]MDE1960098.1 indolepyruvate ferredoxin oxidoreductase family protein [Xanthomonadaceae bacterium]MDE2083559.1 indolepyruvate ferredoxin oxidoreductase family protein [Xanthomonadaceae bacterium]